MIATLAEGVFADQSTHDIALVGEVDVFTGLHRHVTDACGRGARLILLDVTELTTITPSGVADVLQAIRAARSSGGDLRAYGYSPALADALTALDLDKVLTIHVDRQRAITRAATRRAPVRRRVLRQVLIGRHSRSRGSS